MAAKFIRTYCKYSSEKFDLFSLGPRWNKGDYTLANWLFEYITPSFGVNYANIIIDSPAGLEHLNRKVIASINDLFVMLDPSQKSIKHVERVKKITENVGIEYEHLYLVGNYEFDDESEQYLLNCTNEIYLGRMDYDANVKEYNLKGKSLLELSENSPACLSVKRILAKAGYGGD